MRLYEFQAKHVLREHGIDTSDGQLATTPEDAVKAACTIGYPVVVKAQVLTGGRGLAGGIRFANSASEVIEVASTILGLVLNGERARTLLVEKKLIPSRELYAAVTWDYRKKSAVLIGSSRGGVDIESLSKNNPNEIVELPMHPRDDYCQFKGRELGARIGLKGAELAGYAEVASRLFGIFEDHDAELVEVNPLAWRSDGNLVALDAKVELDDRALFRQVALVTSLPTLPTVEKDDLSLRRTRAMRQGIPTYIERDAGNLAIISDGAGSGMLTLDLVSDLGGKTRVYCELGGEITPELIEKAMTVSLSVKDIRVLLINLIGGLNLMDEMAVGIVNYLSRNKSSPPIVVRMTGTNEDEGRRMLSSNGVGFFDGLEDAVRQAIEYSKAN